MPRVPVAAAICSKSRDVSCRKFLDSTLILPELMQRDGQQGLADIDAYIILVGISVWIYQPPIFNQVFLESP